MGKVDKFVMTRGERLGALVAAVLVVAAAVWMLSARSCSRQTGDATQQPSASWVNEADSVTHSARAKKHAKRGKTSAKERKAKKAKKSDKKKKGKSSKKGAAARTKQNTARGSQADHMSKMGQF